MFPWSYTWPACTAVRYLRARVIHAVRRVVTITMNFKMPQSHEKQTFSWWRRDREMRVDRKFKWDLRQSLARKSIVITSADRAARLILRTIYDGPTAQDRSRRSPNELGIEDWSSTVKRGFQDCRWKWRTLRFMVETPCVDTTILNLDTFYVIRGELIYQACMNNLQ